MTATLTIVHSLFRANCAANEKRLVCGYSPRRFRTIGTSELVRDRTHSTALRNQGQPELMCGPRFVASRKSGGAWRELCPEGTSYRPDRSRWRRGKPRVRLFHPRPNLHVGRPETDPLLAGRRAAGETIGSRDEQGGYLKLESLSSDPRPSSRKAGGEGSGSGRYGGSR